MLETDLGPLLPDRSHPPNLPAGGPVGTGDLADSVMRTLVSNDNDAMRLLFQAAAEHAPTEGETPSNAPSASRTLANAGPGTTSPENIPSMESGGPIHFSSASHDVLMVWHPRDDQFGNQADALDDSEARWLGDVVAPAKTSDRMSWMLLGCAQSLALELGLCDAVSKTDPAAILNQPPGLQAQQSRLCLSSTSFEVLSIEYNHQRAFMNSLGIQAVIDRVLGKRPPNATDNEILQSSITATDYAFIKEVIDGSCQTLESVNRLFEAGTLRYSPIRIFLRIITASIFLLKALSLGTRTADLESSLAIMERSIEALRASSLDEMHLAARYGELLAMHLARFRHGMVPVSVPRGIPTAEANGLFEFGNAGKHLGEGLGDLFSLATADDWLALPFDASMAPFGCSSDVPELPELDDRSWDFALESTECLTSFMVKGTG
ncbi:hypothetical protein QQX98_005134 [Neonectria punicea]|uniref:Transcription factor domain-containing protein n=1 Tax=Neonectria punicea TaxID=979145 RepID=A0ABR1H606_9HYPO